MTVQDVDNAFRKKAESNLTLFAIRKKIEAGTATMEDAAKYNEIISNILGKTVGENITKIPESERVKFLDWLLRNQYNDTNERLSVIQKFLDEKQGLHLTPQKAQYPAERVQQLGISLTDRTVPEKTIERRARAGTANISKSFHDGYMEENAKFRNSAGIKCYLNRESHGTCCAWCQAIVGRYEYGKHPDDIFRRHDNCSCTVTFENGRERQDVWSKRTWEVPEEDAGADAPTVFDDSTRPAGFHATVLSPEQAKYLQDRLTIDNRNAIIELRNMANGLRRSALIPLTEQEKAHLKDEIIAIGADPTKFVFRDGYGSGYSDQRDVVFISANIFPSNDDSTHPRDRMSERAAIAHEYYGHRANRNTKLDQGAWNDEFRASYMAARDCPNLTDEDRRYLVLDAIERAKEAGVSIRYNDFIRRVLYG